MRYTVQGTTLAGWWVNVGPGINRIGPIFSSPTAAQRYLDKRL